MVIDKTPFIKKTNKQTKTKNKAKQKKKTRDPLI